MLLKQTNMMMKNLSIYGRTYVTNSYGSNNSVLCGLSLNRFFANETSQAKEGLKAPKRSPNVFALFIKEQYKAFPDNMSNKERFNLIADKWRNLPEDEKDVYRKMMAENMIKYRQEMAAYMQSLSPQEIEELNKFKQVFIDFLLKLLNLRFLF